MDYGKNVFRRRAGRGRTGCCRKGKGNSLRRKILLAQKLADQTDIRPGMAAQMALVGLMLRTGIAVDIGRERLLVMMKRRKEQQRKNDRQEDGSGYVSF